MTKKQIQKNRQLNADFLQKIEAGGIKITRPSAQAMAEFEKVGQSVREKLSATYGADRIAALRQRPRPLASKRRLPMSTSARASRWLFAVERQAFRAEKWICIVSLVAMLVGICFSVAVRSFR